MAAGTLAVAAACVLALNLTNDDGTVSGHVYHCVGRSYGSDAAAACNPGEPVPHTGLLFETLQGGHDSLAETDSKGAYSIKLAPGQYKVKYRVVGSAEHNDAGQIYIGDWGISPITVGPCQRVVLDLTGRALAQ